MIGPNSARSRGGSQSLHLPAAISNVLTTRLSTGSMKHKVCGSGRAAAILGAAFRLAKSARNRSCQWQPPFQSGRLIALRGGNSRQGSAHSTSGRRSPGASDTSPNAISGAPRNAHRRSGRLSVDCSRVSILVDGMGVLADPCVAALNVLDRAQKKSCLRKRPIYTDFIAE